MKRLFLSVCLCLLFTGNAFAWGALGVGQGVGAAVASSCMTGTYTFAWNGGFTGDTDKACYGSSDMTGVDGSVSSALIGTDCGEGSPDVGLRVAADNQHVSYSQSADQYIDDLGAITIWIRLYISQAPLGNTYIFTGWVSLTEYIAIYINTSREIIGQYRGSGNSNSVYGPSAISVATWVDIAYSYDRASANTHSVNTGGSWAADEADSLSSSTVGNITKIEIGETDEGLDFNMDTGQYYQITKWAIVAGYKANKPSGW